MIDSRAKAAQKPAYFHSTPLIPAAVGALAGATLADWRMILAVFAGAYALHIYSRLGHCDGGSRTAFRSSAAVLVACTFFIAGTARGIVWTKKWARVEAQGARAGPIEALLLPVGEVSTKGWGDLATFRARILDPKSLRGIGVEVSVHLAEVPKVRMGRPVTGFGRVSLPSQSMNPGDFDLRRYLASDRVFAVYECSRLDECDGYRVPLSWRLGAATVSRLPSALGGLIDRSMPAEQAGVLKGILLSDRSGISDMTLTNFQRSGFFRFTTVAGFHVDAVFVMVEASIRRLLKRPTAARVSAVCLAAVYAALSGWTPGATRALTCASMRSFAPAFRRRYYTLAGLSVTALICAWSVPFPMTDAGFLLSMAGVAGGFAAARYVRLSDGFRRRTVAGVVRMTLLAAVLFPLMAAYFTEFTLAGFLTGGLWTATVTALIPVSLLVVLIPYLGPLCGWLPYLVIKGTESVSLAVSSSVPLLYVPAPSQVEMLAYYAIMLTVGVAAEGRLRASAARTARPRSPIRAACVLLCSVLMFASAQIRQSPPWLQVTFLSVGQADCAIVRSGRTTIIVDTATSAALSRSVSGYLRRHGITRVDLCVLSHLHQDHSGGLPGLVMEVPVTSLLVPPGSSEDVEAQLAGLAEQGVAANLPIIVEASSGMTYSVDEMSISVACPDVDPGLGGDENYMSLVAVISSANAHKDGGGPVIEFWGDAPKEEISAYLGSYPSLFTAAKERVVKVPHHGSRSSLADRFYERLGGDAAVISVGNNSYGHPSNEVLDAANRNSVRVWRTDLQGAVTVRFAPPHTSVTSYR